MSMWAVVFRFALAHHPPDTDDYYSPDYEQVEIQNGDTKHE